MSPGVGLATSAHFDPPVPSVYPSMVPCSSLACQRCVSVVWCKPPESGVHVSWEYIVLVDELTSSAQ